jgi:hypothetical protein
MLRALSQEGKMNQVTILSGGCNVPPAGRSAQQEIIELKYSAGTLSSSDNPSQMGQKGYIENGVMC